MPYSATAPCTPGSTARSAPATGSTAYPWSLEPAVACVVCEGSALLRCVKQQCSQTDALYVISAREIGRIAEEVREVKSHPLLGLSGAHVSVLLRRCSSTAGYSCGSDSALASQLRNATLLVRKRRLSASSTIQF